MRSSFPRIRSFGAALSTLVLVGLVGSTYGSAGCGSSTPAEADAGPPPCDLACQDRTGARAIREMMKLIYNLTLQGKPVGPQSQSIFCPNGGKASVSGTATSNAEQGTTAVSLVYLAEGCGYRQRDDDPEESYDVVLTGTIEQSGVLAVQPSSSTALVMKASGTAGITLRGTVREPAVPYAVESCPLEMTQNGNKLTATLCGRTVGVDL